MDKFIAPRGTTTGGYFFNLKSNMDKFIVTQRYLSY